VPYRAIFCTHGNAVKTNISMTATRKKNIIKILSINLVQNTSRAEISAF
jgi:hypothetical protein